MRVLTNDAASVVQALPALDTACSQSERPNLVSSTLPGSGVELCEQNVSCGKVYQLIKLNNKE